MRAALILLAVLMVGCNPCKRLTRKCPPVIRDSISYVETIKFDTIHLVSPADTLWFQIPIEAELNDLIVDAGNKPGPSVKIRIKDRVLIAEVICPTDSLKAIITKLEKETNNQTTITVEKEVPVNHIPKWAWICIIGFVVYVLLTAFIVYYKIKTKSLRGLVNALK